MYYVFFALCNDFLITKIFISNFENLKNMKTRFIVAPSKLHLNNKWRHFYDDNFIIFYHCWASSEAATLVVATDVVYVLLYGVYMLDVRIRVVLRWKRKLLCVKRERCEDFFCRVTMANDKDVWIFYKSLRWWECFETFYGILCRNDWNLTGFLSLCQFILPFFVVVK